MRKALRLTLLGVTLLLARAAAHAQTAAPRPGPQRDDGCREAALRYVHPSPDKPHLTVEEEADYEYRQRKMYLRVCGDSDDDFTRSVKASVASHEAARLCEAETWPRYEKRVTVEDAAPPERRKEAYEAAKEYLKVCGLYDITSVWRSTRRVEDYETAARVEEAEKTLASLVPAARAASPSAVAPETYARIAEAYAVARYEPAQLGYARVYGLDRIAYGKRVSPALIRVARVRLEAALDRVIDAYARAVASCGDDAACRESKPSWLKELETYYAFRHAGESRGLEETVARSLGAPMPNLLTR